MPLVSCMSQLLCHLPDCPYVHGELVSHTRPLAWDPPALNVGWGRGWVCQDLLVFLSSGTRERKTGKDPQEKTYSGLGVPGSHTGKSGCGRCSCASGSGGLAAVPVPLKQGRDSPPCRMEGVCGDCHGTQSTGCAVISLSLWWEVSRIPEGWQASVS